MERKKATKKKSSTTRKKKKKEEPETETGLLGVAAKVLMIGFGAITLWKQIAFFVKKEGGER